MQATTPSSAPSMAAPPSQQPQASPQIPAVSQNINQVAQPIITQTPSPRSSSMDYVAPRWFDRESTTNDLWDRNL